MEIRQYIDQLRKFLFSFLNRDFLIFLFFLVLSGAFWLSTALDDTIDREYPIVVSLADVPEDVVVTTDIADTIHLVLRDKGYSMLSYWLSGGLSPASFQFPKYASNEHKSGVIAAADIQKAVMKSLHASTKVMSMKPDRLIFYFNHGQRKEVPVRVTGRMEPAASYYLADTRVDPARVAVYADQAILDSLKSVTAEIDITNFEDTVVRTVPLQRLLGVKCVPQEVTVTLCPDILTEQTMEVPITTIGLPSDKVLRTFPGRAVVRFNVGASIFRQIKPEHFSVVANYADISSGGSEKCTLRLVKTPQVVRNARLDTPQVDYLIEQR